MDDKKRDLIPVAAIALFLVIIIALCAVRLHQRRETRAEIAETESTQIWYSEEQAESAESETKDAADQTEETTAGKKQTTERGQQEDETLTEHPDSKLPAGKGKESQGAKQEGNLRTVSGNDPLSGAESANKTNEEMLLEMSGYWEQDNMDAVEDLAMLPWYMRMSSDISDANSFYYYGERSSAGQPDGTGIACYADNAYYYGEWSNGKREGNGKWVRFYVYYDDDTTSDRAYREHMYAGEWKNDLPDGEGQEHYELDMSKAAKKERYIQNVIGTFRSGFYSGEMYLTTLNWDGNQEEWNGFADAGIWSPYGAGSNRKEVPVCQDVDDEFTAAREILKELAAYAGQFKREPIPVSELVVGMKCGGSDGLSGITANPTIGRFSDMMGQRGGSTVLTEVPEMFGAEGFLMDRCINKEVFVKAEHMINGFKEYFISHNEVVYDNPSPGNKQGGITTLEDKSCGCVQKGGSSPICGVLSYGQRVQNRGLTVLQTPGNDLVSTTALAAAGAHMVLFTTGRGTPFAGPVPTLKISTNTALAQRKPRWIDFNAGTLVQGDSWDDAAEALLDRVMATASGLATCSENLGYRELAIWKDGVTL